jgi:V4R domain-containing protein
VASEILKEAGFATGESLIDAWNARVAEQTGLRDAAQLDAAWFGPLLEELCCSLGWGTLSAATVGTHALLLSSPDWAEAEPGSTEHPGCYFSCGCLAAFLSELAAAPLAILEVECRSNGGGHCRFLAGSPETLAAVYDLVAAGRSWREGFLPTELPN